MELLARVASGEWDAEHPKVRQRFDADPGLRLQLQEMALAYDDLDSIGGVLADVKWDSQATDADDASDVDMSAIVDGHFAREDSPSAMGAPALVGAASQVEDRRWRTAALSLAAILVLGLGIGLLTGGFDRWFAPSGQAGGGGGGEADPMLGAAAEFDMKPAATDRSGANPDEVGASGVLRPGMPFEWIAVRDADYYRLQVRTPDGDAVSMALNDLQQAQWRPTSDQYFAIPVLFEWRMTAYDSNDRLLAMSGWVRAARAPR
ncbi:MAG: hypothetical protein AB8H80_01280 [Planctomycetota bacterium]